jgi:hypothetical protein
MPRNLDDLIPLGEIPVVFSYQAIAFIAASLSMGVGAQFQASCNRRLGESIRASVRGYVAARRRLTPNTVRREIKAIARAAASGDYESSSGDYESLSQLWNVLSADARHLLQRRADAARNTEEACKEARLEFEAIRGKLLRPHRDSERHTVAMPTADDLRDPDRQATACDAIFRLAVTGRGCDWEWWGLRRRQITTDGVL